MTPLHLHGTLSFAELAGDISYDLTQLPLDGFSGGSSTLHAKVTVSCHGDASGRHLPFFMQIAQGRDPARGPHTDVRFRAEQCMSIWFVKDKSFFFWFQDRFEQLANDSEAPPFFIA